MTTWEEGGEGGEGGSLLLGGVTLIQGIHQNDHLGGGRGEKAAAAGGSPSSARDINRLSGELSPLSPPLTRI